MPLIRSWGGNLQGEPATGATSAPLQRRLAQDSAFVTSHSFWKPKMTELGLARHMEDKGKVFPAHCTPRAGTPAVPFPWQTRPAAPTPGSSLEPDRDREP